MINITVGLQIWFCGSTPEDPALGNKGRLCKYLSIAALAYVQLLASLRVAVVNIECSQYYAKNDCSWSFQSNLVLCPAELRLDEKFS